MVAYLAKKLRCNDKAKVVNIFHIECVGVRNWIGLKSVFEVKMS